MSVHPKHVDLRAIVLLPCLAAASLASQTAATSPAPTRVGAAPTRANGVPPSTPAASRTSRRGRSSGPGASDGGANSSQAPAAAANSSVEVIGQSAAIRIGTADRPLLPIVSPGNALGIRSGTPIVVSLKQTVDSGRARNGQTLDATLAKPLAGLPVGTPVKLTVVAASPAGQLFSYGVLSVQVVSIADRNVLSDTITAQGKEGAKELPDAAPARGTEAVFSPGQPISLPVA